MKIILKFYFFVFALHVNVVCILQLQIDSPLIPSEVGASVLATISEHSVIVKSSGHYGSDAKVESNIELNQQENRREGKSSLLIITPLEILRNLKIDDYVLVEATSPQEVSNIRKEWT